MIELTDISIVDFLERLGHHPVKQLGTDFFYHSMLRKSKDDNPTFIVSDQGRKWADHGNITAESISSGGIIQLGMAYWPKLSFVDILNRIRKAANQEVSQGRELVAPMRKQSSEERGASDYELVRISPAGSNFILAKCLEDMGIGGVADGRLNDIYYRFSHDRDDERTFWAIGWQNDLNGWEFITETGFRDHIGPRSITIVPGVPSHVALFDDYIHYLQWQAKESSEPVPTIIVLNAIPVIGRTLERLKEVSAVDVYFGNDGKSRRAASELLGELPHAQDRSAKLWEFIGPTDVLSPYRSNLRR